MVKLNKIYTRTGDDGKTSLVGGGRVSKHAKRPAAYGEVDELNSVLGMARLQCGADTANAVMDSQLARIQNDLFDLGADLATVDDMKPALRITATQVARLEQEIDEINENLSSLNSFILPGGTPLAAWLHLARTVARRAERQMTELATVEPANEHAMQYINRLSDLLFVLARHANDGGKSDILWVPGGTQENDKA
ncbi:MAG: cob(I)yrinic acid a,c-diamide adenosyltransferase [Alphaproteobacteria bacterium]|nr:cob(I)yrinic acid a,c-diamide adenosyltransferase [Alphaproteobacteria bacterium]MBL6776076.1 cob(I)yrinic acid a,c-diamide adenosyltransferase [Alphaproteobacteria bacterium]